MFQKLREVFQSGSLGNAEVAIQEVQPVISEDIYHHPFLTLHLRQ